MKEIDLTQQLRQSFESDYVRDKKRISVSKVYALLNDWEDRPADLLGMVRMVEGRSKHEMVQVLLPDYQHEVKIERPFGDGWVLVGKADCVAEDHILEIKTSREVMTKAKEWHVLQLRLYLTLLEKPVGYIAQPCFTGEKLYLKVLRACKRNDEWFAGIINQLNEKLKK